LGLTSSTLPQPRLWACLQVSSRLQWSAKHHDTTDCLIRPRMEPARFFPRRGLLAWISKPAPASPATVPWRRLLLEIFWVGFELLHTISIKGFYNTNQLYLFQKTIEHKRPTKDPAASIATSQTSAVRKRSSQSCQHSSAIPKQQQNANKAHGKPSPPLPNAPHARIPSTAYSIMCRTWSCTDQELLGRSSGVKLDRKIIRKQYATKIILDIMDN